MTEHYYQTIQGWFDWQDTYRRWARELPDDGVIVEVGCFKGKSTAFLCVELENADTRASVYAVDTWQGSPEMQHVPGAQTAYEEFSRNLRPFLASDGPRRLLDCQGDSSQVGRTWSGAQADYIWLDGDHTLEGLTRDLDAWWPRLKPGGEMGGHDFGHFGVQQALEGWSRRKGLLFDILPPCPEAGGVNVGHSWLIRKPLPVTSWETPAGHRSLLIAVASNERTIYQQTTASLAQLMLTAKEQAEPHGFADVGWCWSRESAGVDDMRDMAVFAAKRERVSHLLFLDADMVWPSDFVSRILQYHAAGIVSGLYHLKTAPFHPVALVKAEDDPDPHMHRYARHIHEERHLTAVDAVGMGCTLLPMGVFDAMERPWFEYRRNADGFNRISEDVPFCAKARAMGVPIWVDPTLACGHLLTTAVGVRNYEAHVAAVDAAHREKARRAREAQMVEDARAAQSASLREDAV